MFPKKIEIDGNDGTGKTTLVEALASHGIQAQDRGKMTKATDDPEVKPDRETCYILLDAPVEVCQQRLLAAGKDLGEQYHRKEDLVYYQKRFLEVAKRFGAFVIDAESRRQTLQAALSIVRNFDNPRTEFKDDKYPHAD